jgi:AMMECR1 domain-containing protein
MPTVFAGLMCHAPIVIPAVAGPRAELCRNTTRTMRELAWRAVNSGAERLVLISPHSPRQRTAWGAWSGRIRGDLGAFGHPGVRVDLPGDPSVIEALGLSPISSGQPLDHGAVVPLHFLVEQGWTGPAVVIALPWEQADCERLGQALAALPGRTAVIASGDMSHRLIPEAPAGFHPRARDFDAAFVQALIEGESILELPWQQEAAEDVVDSSRVARASAPWLNAQVLSYEGPWGVGYTQAVFHDPRPPLWAIARDAIAAQVRMRDHLEPPGPPSRGVFCTLTVGGELRGCIGHVEPVFGDLHRELAMVAQAAASQDPRFSAVTEDELWDLEIEVTLLAPPEPGRPRDPRTEGCIVQSGRRRGLLLPDIEGVDTVEEQIAICRRKARIGPHELVDLYRFGSRKVAPPGPPS